jgi:hypothetical protein
VAIVVNFIKENAVWVYGACALIALWYLRVAILARRERRYAVFALERETALNRVYGGWTAAIALLVVMGLVYLLSTVVSDAVQPLVEEVSTATPTPLVARASASPTLPIPEIIILGTDTPTPRPRPTLRPQPTVELITPTPAIQAPGCPDARAVITAPGINAAVSGMTAIFGTATHERFQYYKLEYGAGANPQVWSYFDGGDKPVRGGRLGTLNAGALPPGAYAIRIVVVDASGNFPPPCVTMVVVR